MSIHAPFRLVRSADNKQEVIKQLDVIEKLCKKIKIENVVIHPTDLPQPKILDRYSFNVSTENLPKNRNITISKLEKIFKKYPKIGLCLDISHSYYWSKYETSKLIKAFEDKITQIHFSGTYRGKDHQSLRKVSRDFMYSILPIFEMDVPIVIEEDIKIKSKKYLVDEIKFIREMFKK